MLEKMVQSAGRFATSLLLAGTVMRAERAAAEEHTGTRITTLNLFPSENYLRHQIPGAPPKKEGPCPPYICPPPSPSGAPPGEKRPGQPSEPAGYPRERNSQERNKSNDAIGYLSLVLGGVGLFLGYTLVATEKKCEGGTCEDTLKTSKDTGYITIAGSGIILATGLYLLLD